MNYNEALEYIHSISWQFCRPGLERIGELCEKLGHPERELRFVHVAGTNGKGSFCSMLDSVLRSAGYRTGLYTSPYIVRFNERMCACGEPISDGELADITAYVKPIADSMLDKPTEFELITAIAFEFFKRKRCEIVILEAGMGGRLDSTNIIEKSILSVITGIALDHTAFLGETVEKIAAEKAGIIKPSCPVLLGGEGESVREVIAAKAKDMNAELFTVDYSKLSVTSSDLSGSLFDFGAHKAIEISLLGSYQPRNAAAVVSAVDVMREKGFDISEFALKEGLKNAVWHARFEIVRRDPLVIFDGAHNPDGVDAAVKSIETYFKARGERVFVLTGVLSDKEYRYIASRIASVTEKAFVISPDNPRALDADQYADVLCSFGVEATPFNELATAVSCAIDEAKRAECALVCLGSLYLYGDIIKLI